MNTANIIVGGKSLTPCEFEIIRLAVMGKSRKEIADALNKKPTTIDSHMHVLHRVLGVTSIGGLVAWGCEHGFDSSGNYTPKEEVPAAHPLQNAERAQKSRRKKMRNRGRGAWDEGRVKPIR